MMSAVSTNSFQTKIMCINTGKIKNQKMSLTETTSITNSIVGLVVEFVVAIDEARVRFTDDAGTFFFFFYPFIVS